MTEDGDSMGKQDDNIRLSDPVAHGPAELTEHLRPAAMFFAQFTVSSFHTLVSANDHYAHLSFLSCHAIAAAGSPPCTISCSSVRPFFASVW